MESIRVAFQTGIRQARQALPAAGIQVSRSRSNGTAIPLCGLANEAFACRVKAKHKTRMERVAGRVRKRAFIVDVSTDQRQSRAELLLIAKEGAGQVAGDLF